MYILRKHYGMLAKYNPVLRVTVPALFEPSLSLASPFPNAPVPASVSPSQVSVAPGGDSPVLHAPGVHVQSFPVAFRREGGSKVRHQAKTFAFHTNNVLHYLRISAARRTRSIRSCILCSFIFSNGKMSSPLLAKGRCLLFIISN